MEGRPNIMQLQHPFACASLKLASRVPCSRQGCGVRIDGAVQQSWDAQAGSHVVRMTVSHSTHVLKEFVACPLAQSPAAACR